MQYAFDKIDTAAGYEALLALAQKKKQVQERQGRNLAASINTCRQRMDYISRETAIVQTLLTAYTPAFNALPEGKDKAHLNVEIKRLELRQATLNKKALIYNASVLLVKEVKYNMLLSKLSATDTYIKALQDRIMMLPHTAAPVASRTSADFRPAITRLGSRTTKRSYKKLAHLSPLSTLHVFNDVESHPADGLGHNSVTKDISLNNTASNAANRAQALEDHQP